MADENSQTAAEEEAKQEELVRQIVHVDAETLFTQLQIITTLVKVGHRGLFLTTIPCSDGVLRLFRSWLSEMCGETTSHTTAGKGSVSIEKGKGLEHEAVDEDDRMKVKGRPWDHGILWVNSAPSNQDVGIRFRVKRRQWRRDVPVLWESEEEIGVSYEIEYEGKSFRLSFACDV